MKGVVVGVSPNTGSADALRWGWEEARLRDLPLRAVLAWKQPRPASAPGGRPPVTTYADVDPEEQAQAALRTFVGAALSTTDGIELLPMHGNPVPVLVRASADAHVLVLGQTRPGRLGSVRTGLIAPQVVMQARCPVVVMPSGEQVER